MARDLDITWDTNTGELTFDRTGPTNYFKRGETLTLSVTVLADGASGTIPANAIATIKPVNDYDPDHVLARWTAFARVAMTNVYTASTTINGAYVTTLLGMVQSDWNCVLDLAGDGVNESDTVAIELKNNVTRDDDTAPTVLLSRNDFLVSNGTGLLANVSAGISPNGLYVAAQSGVVITNATNYIELDAAGLVSVNTSGFTAGKAALAIVVASAGAIVSNTVARPWLTPKPGASSGSVATSVARDDGVDVTFYTPTADTAAARGVALAAAIAACAAGDSITIGPGTFNGSFTLPTGVVLRGSGEQFTTISGTITRSDKDAAYNIFGLRTSDGVYPLTAVQEKEFASGATAGSRYRARLWPVNCVMNADGSWTRLASGTATRMAMEINYDPADAGPGLHEFNMDIALTGAPGPLSFDKRLFGFQIGCDGSRGSNSVFGNLGCDGNFSAESDTTSPHVQANDTTSVRALRLASSTAPLSSGIAGIRFAGGSNGWLDIVPLANTDYIAICASKGQGIYIADGTGGHGTYLTAPATGTLKVTTDGSTTGTVIANLTGNAATVTTNANLTGPVTSSGNATAIANGVIANAMLANGAVANLSGTNTGDNATNSQYSGLVSNATHTGDATGATALTLATVNSNVGSFTKASLTVNAKGLITAASSGAADPSGANPSASAGLSAVNGSASTFMRSDGAPAISQSIAPTWTGIHTFTPTARGSGSAAFLTITTPADTAQTASTESTGFNKTEATRQFATGALALQREVVFGAPTYSFVGASTLTDAVNLDVPEPVAGTNATFTRKKAIRAQSLEVYHPTANSIFDVTSGGILGRGFRITATTGAIYTIGYFGTAPQEIDVGQSGTPLNLDGSQVNLRNTSFTNAVNVNGTTVTIGVNLKVGSAGTNITNIRHGVSGAMVLGSVTITDTGCTANTRYFFTAHTLGTITIPGGYYAMTRNAGASVVVVSSQATETSTLDWFACEP
jgi:hypothetical protein